MKTLDRVLAWIVIHVVARARCAFGVHVPEYIKLRQASRQVRRSSGLRLVANGAQCGICKCHLGGSRV